MGGGVVKAGGAEVFDRTHWVAGADRGVGIAVDVDDGLGGRGDGNGWGQGERRRGRSCK